MLSGLRQGQAAWQIRLIHACKVRLSKNRAHRGVNDTPGCAIEDDAGLKLRLRFFCHRLGFGCRCTLRCGLSRRRVRRRGCGGGRRGRSHTTVSIATIRCRTAGRRRGYVRLRRERLRQRLRGRARNERIETGDRVVVTELVIARQDLHRFCLELLELGIAPGQTDGTRVSVHDAIDDLV